MGLFKKSSKAYAILNLKCPTCHSEDLFETATFSFNKPFEMRERCPHCNQDFWPEPGYYYGSMFLSYIFTGFFCLGFVFFFHWGLGWSTEASFALLIAVCAVIFVYVFRVARSLWININFGYKPEKAKQA
ncbi:MAG: DUF983 domain-containing protein [Saprospiraceae bacterium]|nr:DUF983 domain-containing protein [Saprospiraceae bacterium]